MFVSVVYFGDSQFLEHLLHVINCLPWFTKMLLQTP